MRRAVRDRNTAFYVNVNVLYRFNSLSDHFRDQRSDGEDEQQGLARQNSALFD